MYIHITCSFSSYVSTYFTFVQKLHVFLCLSICVWYMLIMVALCNRADHNIFMLFLLLSSFFSSPNLSGRRLDVYHTLACGVALVRI